MLATTHHDLIESYRETADIAILPILADALEDAGVDRQIILHGVCPISLRIILRHVVLFYDELWRVWQAGVPRNVIDTDFRVCGSTINPGTDIVPPSCIGGFDPNDKTYIVVPSYQNYILATGEIESVRAKLYAWNALCIWLDGVMTGL